ncbi:hypothetical protein ZWY2020_047704 [Hordeum vulgare]|nr:hypothetical protein ZWY2020_047704 [Hordeum vulgare]
MASPPVSNGLGCVGGRFWALANEELDRCHKDDIHTPASSPTPSDLVCESILVGYSEEQVGKCIDGFVPESDAAWNGLQANDEDKVAVLRRVVHRRTSANAVRPWKGPLSKLLLARGRECSGLPLLLFRGVALLLPDEVVLEDITVVAEVATKDTKAIQINGTSMLAVRVVVVRIGTPEEVLGEVLISGTVPSNPPKAILWRVLEVQIFGKEASVEYATLAGKIRGRRGRKLPKRPVRKRVPPCPHR